MHSLYYYGFDSLYAMLVIPAIIIAVWSQIKVKTTFSKYSGFRCDVTGAEAARRSTVRKGLLAYKTARRDSSRMSDRLSAFNSSAYSGTSL